MKSPAFQFYPADYLSSERVSLLTAEAEGVYIRLLCHCWKNETIPEDVEDLRRLLFKKCSKDAIISAKSMFIPDKNQPGRLRHDRLDDERNKQEKNRESRKNGGKRGMLSRWGDNSAITQLSSSNNSAITQLCHPVITPDNSSTSSSTSSSTAVINVSCASGAGQGVANPGLDARKENGNHQIIDTGENRAETPSGDDLSGIGCPDTNPPPKSETEAKSSRMRKPSKEEWAFHAHKIGLPPQEADKCWTYYESNGWRVGRNPMKSWTHAMQNWKLNYDTNRHANGSRNRNDRNSWVAAQTVDNDPGKPFL